ncbi:hypothetical protein K2173_010615 [Erythroxylum novogranatense]|uniref:Uncharacterized protein n=1 Tax=Erythroxylum novogranatense TaxID=1862640 RepID=A0AAV8TE27_9ROSI|nr:hypothetical protein K2173_010615 [Erythroxylum novogranatense]
MPCSQTRGSIQSAEQHTQPSTGQVRDCEFEDGSIAASEGAPAGDTSKDNPSEDYTGQMAIDAVDHADGVAQNSTVFTHQAEQGELAHETASTGGGDHADRVARNSAVVTLQVAQGESAQETASSGGEAPSAVPS